MISIVIYLAILLCMAASSLIELRRIYHQRKQEVK